MDRPKTMERLKKRAEFLAAAGGARASRRGFLLQKRERDAGDGARFGFTVTKKMGNSPERNRIRRRLREAVRLAAGPLASPSADYVLIGRRAALSLSFDDMVRDLVSGLKSLDRSAAERSAPRASSRDDSAPVAARSVPADGEASEAAPTQSAPLGKPALSAERPDR